jgi:solute:Na+ symporter, SSS family
LILIRIPAGAGQVVSFLRENGSLQLMDFSFDPRKVFTVWSVCIGMTVSRCGTYMADQMSLQRFIASGDMRSASRSFLINIFGAMAVTGSLVFVGLAILAWYHFVPDANLPADADQVFPYFIATQLPTGLTGIFLAAILAATVSSMTSGINALSATLTLDFRNRFWGRRSPGGDLWFAKVSSAAIGTVATVSAGFIGVLGSIFDITQALLGVFLGPLFGCMYFAVGKRPVCRGALLAGMVLGLLAGGGVTFSEIASIWVAAIALFVTIAITYLGTFLKRCIIAP